MKALYNSTVSTKLSFSLLVSVLWVTFSLWIAMPWLSDLSETFNPTIAWMILLGIAIIPGWAMSFVLPSLLLDRRPKHTIEDEKDYPDITIIIAAFNEEKNILKTLKSLCKQKYPNKVRVIISNDGSKDSTATIVQNFINDNRYPENFTFELLDNSKNMGKAEALNSAIVYVNDVITITIDADSQLYKNALKKIVSYLVLSETEFKAVAGNVLVKNHKKNLITKIQQWDYFHGISVMKRVQSMYQGALVAQGAFSAYDTAALREVNGWKDTVGEDIVLTWALRSKGYKVGYCEAAICFTRVPEKLTNFIKQRIRWARGLIEGFKSYPNVIWNVKKNSPFIWYNLTFPLLDFVYIFAFIPGVIAALFFGYYTIAGLLTLLLLPLAVISTIIYYKRQREILFESDLKPSKNYIGLLFYIFFYQSLMSFASLIGYANELFGRPKEWGTKS